MFFNNNNNNNNNNNDIDVAKFTVYVSVIFLLSLKYFVWFSLQFRQLNLNILL